MELKTIGVLAALFAVTLLLLAAVLPTRVELPNGYHSVPPSNAVAPQP